MLKIIKAYEYYEYRQVQRHNEILRCQKKKNVYILNDTSGKKIRHFFFIFLFPNKFICILCIAIALRVVCTFHEIKMCKEKVMTTTTNRQKSIPQNLVFILDTILSFKVNNVCVCFS